MALGPIASVITNREMIERIEYTDLIGENSELYEDPITLVAWTEHQAVLVHDNRYPVWGNAIVIPWGNVANMLDTGKWSFK